MKKNKIKIWSAGYIYDAGKYTCTSKCRLCYAKLTIISEMRIKKTISSFVSIAFLVRENSSSSIRMFLLIDVCSASTSHMNSR